MPAFLVTAMSVPAQPAHPYRERREEEEREEERLSELGVIERLKEEEGLERSPGQAAQS